MTHELGHTYQMTFDLHLTFDLDTGIKILNCYKVPYLLQITRDGDRSWSCDLPFVGAYWIYTDLPLIGAYEANTQKRSKVIKGSFPVLSEKT